MMAAIDWRSLSCEELYSEVCAHVAKGTFANQRMLGRDGIARFISYNTDPYTIDDGKLRRKHVFYFLLKSEMDGVFEEADYSRLYSNKELKRLYNILCGGSLSEFLLDEMISNDVTILTRLGRFVEEIVEPFRRKRNILLPLLSLSKTSPFFCWEPFHQIVSCKVLGEGKFAIFFEIKTKRGELKYVKTLNSFNPIPATREARIWSEVSAIEGFAKLQQIYVSVSPRPALFDVARDAYNSSKMESKQSTPGYGPAYGSPRYLPGQGSPQYDQAQGSPQYKQANGSPGYGLANCSPRYKSVQGSRQYLSVQGSPQYDQAQGSPQYEQANDSPGYGLANCSPQYKPVQGSPKYLPVQGSPQYDQANCSPQYKPVQGSPQYEQANGSPGYGLANCSPRYKPVQGSRQYLSVQGSPQYDQAQGSPQYEQANDSPGYGLANCSPQYKPVQGSPKYLPVQGSPQYEQANDSPGYGLANCSPQYKPAQGSRQYLPVQGSPQYDQANCSPQCKPVQGSPQYEQANGSPGYGLANCSPQYKPAQGSRKYLPVQGSPQYDQANCSPRYKPVQGSPQYKRALGSPQYDQAQGSPQYEQANGSLGYGLANCSPQYKPAQGSPQYDQANCSPQYKPVQGSPQYDQANCSPQYKPAQGSRQYLPVQGSPQYEQAQGSPQYDQANCSPGHKPVDRRIESVHSSPRHEHEDYYHFLFNYVRSLHRANPSLLPNHLLPINGKNDYDDLLRLVLRTPPPPPPPLLVDNVHDFQEHPRLIEQTAPPTAPLPANNENKSGFPIVTFETVYAGRSVVDFVTEKTAASSKNWRHMLLQLFLSIREAEIRFQFEHRDLHGYNILISVEKIPGAKRTHTIDTKDIRTNARSWKVFTVSCSDLRTTIIDFGRSRITKRDSILFYNFGEKPADPVYLNVDIDNNLGNADIDLASFHEMIRVLNGRSELYRPETNMKYLKGVARNFLKEIVFREENEAAKCFKIYDCIKKAHDLEDLLSNEFIDFLGADFIDAVQNKQELRALYG
ncbi:unnamed protein product [Caenorhabditis sp. 36 PRJEB53466]|nr:unnamed protein product [Caenorhabditis sp. 36 PRJEB53466]